MKSSKNIKTNIDDISQETQRLVKDSHVCLPYHKPKQKSLKDFLNRQKISSDYQASITGSKKLLQKAWEIIENKEQNIEQFYNEDFTIDDSNKKELPTIHVEKDFSLNDDSNNYCNLENLKIKISEISDDEESSENKYLMDGELLANDVMSSFNDNEKEDSRHSSDNQVVQHYVKSNLSTKNLDDHTDFHDTIDSEDESKENIVKEFIDDEIELSELNYNSDDDGNVTDFLDDSDDAFSKKKKRRLVLLSESSNDDEKDYDDINNLNTEINSTSNDLKQLFNETKTNISTQQLLGLCSGQFQTQQPETEDIDQESEDYFDSDVYVKRPLNDDDNMFDNEDAKMLNLTSAKDYFDDEAELSESDWSSDEEYLVDSIDKLEEEAGDKDKLNDDTVKDGLDKIYIRQLLDDDQEQVSALKEMLLEDGELHTDFGRKRKFQWDEADHNDTVLKKPLFSDNDEEDDVILSDEEKTGQWQKERFKRESYLSQKNDSEDDDINEINESSNILQTSIPVVNRTHIVKYSKDESKKMSNTIRLNQNDKSIQLNDDIIDKNDDNASILIPVLTGPIMINKIKENYSIDLPPPIASSFKSNKLVKGSFMKRGDKMTNTLLFMNKKSLIIYNDESNGKTFKGSSEIKTLSTITANASNPFAYLLRNDKKPEKQNLAVSNLTNVEKTEKNCFSIPCTSNQLSQKPQLTKNRKSVNSILKQLE